MHFNAYIHFSFFVARHMTLSSFLISFASVAYTEALFFFMCVCFFFCFFYDMNAKQVQSSQNKDLLGVSLEEIAFLLLCTQRKPSLTHSMTNERHIWKE